MGSTAKFKVLVPSSKRLAPFCFMQVLVICRRKTSFSSSLSSLGISFPLKGRSMGSVWSREVQLRPCSWQPSLRSSPVLSALHTPTARGSTRANLTAPRPISMSLHVSFGFQNPKLSGGVFLPRCAVKPHEGVNLLTTVAKKINKNKKTQKRRFAHCALAPNAKTNVHIAKTQQNTNFLFFIGSIVYPVTNKDATSKRTHDPSSPRQHRSSSARFPQPVHRLGPPRITSALPPFCPDRPGLRF